jgi:hypothetical protein
MQSFLSPREMNRVLHNDRALVRVSGVDRKGRREGKIVEVLERNTQQVVGRLAICFRPVGRPPFSSSCKINSRLGIGCSYFSASR